ncbi:MAG: PA2779 family protein [Desulfohalobiaceae bacterium]|nr:PA2779 family protein [Desulfohalobiaceae bacterium]
MRYVLSIRKPVAMVMILAFVNLILCLGPASAAMIDTSDMLHKESGQLDKQRLLTLLERQEVQQKLQAWGVDSETARSRINGLTDRELSQFSQKMGALPAGGSAVGAIVGAGLVIFIVLLITDILGYTNVFTFVRR